MAINGDNYVVQHNKLIEHKGNMTLLEQKIFRAVISEIKIDDQDLKEYKIPISELKMQMEASSNNTYDQIKAAMNKLLGRTIQLENYTDERREFFITHLISSVRYREDDHEFTVTIHPQLKPYFIDLTAHFTKYQLKYVMQMGSVYALRIYEIIKSRKIIKESYNFVLDIETLKNMIGITSEYPRFYDFEKNVLKIAQNEINKHADIIVEYEKVYKNNKPGKGAAIEKINFIVSAKDSFKAQYIECLKGYYSLNDLLLRSGLEKESFNLEQMLMLYEIAVEKADGYMDPFEYINQTNRYINLKRTGTIRSKYKYLLKSLSEDYGKIVQMAQIERMMKDRSELNRD